MLVIVSVEQAQISLSRLIQQALEGDEVIIAQDGQWLVRLTPFVPESDKRPAPGVDAGKVLLFPDFDDPLDEF